MGACRVRRGCDTKFLSGKAPTSGAAEAGACTGAGAGTMRLHRFFGGILATCQGEQQSETRQRAQRGPDHRLQGHFPMVSRALQIGQCNTAPHGSPCSTHPRPARLAMSVWLGSFLRSTSSPGCARMQAAHRACRASPSFRPARFKEVWYATSAHPRFVIA